MRCVTSVPRTPRKWPTRHSKCISSSPAHPSSPSLSKSSSTMKLVCASKLALATALCCYTRATRSLLILLVHPSLFALFQVSGVLLASRRIWRRCAAPGLKSTSTSCSNARQPHISSWATCMCGMGDRSGVSDLRRSAPDTRPTQSVCTSAAIP